MDATRTIFIRALRSTRNKKPTFRQSTNWTLLSNDDLKFALDVLSLHNSPYEVQAANEITRRIIDGSWYDVDQPIRPTENLPAWIKVWPFCLMWKQRPIA